MKSEERAPRSGERETGRRALTLEAAAALFSGRVARHPGADDRSSPDCLDEIAPPQRLEE